MAFIEDPGAGFANPPLDGQSNFRAILKAMSRPGMIQTLNALPPGSDAQMGVALTLFDHETPIWLDDGAAPLRQRLAFHCGCPTAAEPSQAAFALLTNPEGLSQWPQFGQGDPEFPDRSTTLICELPALEGGDGLTLRGPGMNGPIRFSPKGLPDGFIQSWAMNTAQYPLGVDLILTSQNALAALPRTCLIGG